MKQIDIVLLSIIAGLPVVTYYTALLSDVMTVSAVPLSLLAVVFIMCVIFWTIRTEDGLADVGLALMCVAGASASAAVAGCNGAMDSIGLSGDASVVFVGGPALLVLASTTVGSWLVTQERGVVFWKVFALFASVPTMVAFSMYSGMQGDFERSLAFMFVGVAMPILMYITNFRWDIQKVQSVESAARTRSVPIPVRRDPAE